MARSDCEVVVVGGGIVGISCALWLQREGLEVVVVERTRPGDGASGHNGGIFSLINAMPIGTLDNLKALPRLARGPAASVPIDVRHVPRMRAWGWHLLRASGNASVRRTAAALAPLLRSAVDGYREIADSEQLDMLVDGGLLYVNRSAEAYEAGEKGRELRRSVGLSFETVDDAWLGEKLPDSLPDYARGTYVENAPYVHSPMDFTQSLAALFVARGGRLVTAVGQSFVEEQGRIVGVQTSLDVIRARTVVIAAGSWSQSLTNLAGVRCLLDTERGYGYEFAEVDTRLPFPLIDDDLHVAFTPTATGMRVVGSSELAGLATPPKEATFARVRAGTRAVFGDLDFDAATRWMSFRPSTPDSMPYLGPLPGHANVVAAFGHGHIGFTIASITGRLVAEHVTSNATSIDIAPFAPGRFTSRRRLRQASGRP